MATTKIVAFSCLHAPLTHKGYFDWLIGQIEAYRPQTIVNLGDWYEGKFAKKWAKHSDEDWSVLTEHKAVAAQAVAIRGAAPKARKIWIAGNHDCFDDQTEVLTDTGWRYFHDLTHGEKLASCDAKMRLTFDEPMALITKFYEGEMLEFEGKAVSFCVTPTHRMVYRKGNGGAWRIDTAEKMLGRESSVGGRQVEIPTAATIAGALHEFTEAEVRLCAWILTDGSYGGNNTILYQRPETVGKITDLLDRRGIEYTVNVRNRKIDAIMGRTLVADAKPQCVVYIRAKHRGLIRSWLPSKHDLPYWVYTLNQGLFDAFLESYIDGGGTNNGLGDGASIYGTYSMLSQLQAACFMHGYRAVLKEYRDGDWKLKVCKVRASTILKPKSAIKRKAYSGNVYCATMPMGTLVVRRNGKPMVCGNCNSFNVHPGRTESDIVPAVHWRENREASKALETWEVVEKYGHGVYKRLGPITFRHGCELSKAGIKRETVYYATPYGLHVSGHTHRPTDVTQLDLNGAPLPYWNVNPGCGAEWDRMHYMDRLNKQSWGRGVVLIETAGVEQSRAAYRSKMWDAELRIHSMADTRF